VNKSYIRKRIINLRKKNHSNHEVNAIKVIKLIKKNSIKSKKVGVYYPSNNEISTINLIKLLIKKNFSVSLPVVKEKSKLLFYSWNLYDPLKLNKYGIPEPVRKKLIEPNILVIPIVAFDKNLNRIGYGGGYYDRFIQKIERKFKCLKIGLALSFQEVKKIPINKYDKKMDLIITEKKIYK
tara:strand:- start:280 stop:822 length:543 start_codon:yes stop_codon:yes gene_type:complete